MGVYVKVLWRTRNTFHTQPMGGTVWGQQFKERGNLDIEEKKLFMVLIITPVEMKLKLQNYKITKMSSRKR